MSEDDSDGQRARRDSAFDAGKRTLFDAPAKSSNDPSGARATGARGDIFARWTQGISTDRDPVTEADVQVRKLREILPRLGGQLSPAARRIVREELKGQLDVATDAVARAIDLPNGHAVAEALMALVPDAESLLADGHHGDGAHAASDPVAIARRGVDGPGQSVPHAAEVQHLLGAHDLSGIRAHVGGNAASASRELGAHAYAHGNDIAFAEQPDASMVAHEVTHVLQQRAGVSLKGIDGGSGDAHEQQANAVESRVARGQSAADLLSTSGSGGGVGPSLTVQRKSGTAAAPTSATHDDGPPTVKAPHAKWPVFSESNLPYKFESKQPPVRFWTVSDWIRAGAGFQSHGNHARSPACAAEIIRALGWVEEKHVALAAKNIIFDVSRRVMPLEVSASAFYFMGMPSSAPVVSRAGSDTLYVATRLDDPNVPPGTPVEADDAQRLRVIRALSEFTGLAPEPHALDNLRNDGRLREFVVQSGVLLWKIDREAGNGIFGYDETSDDSGPFTRWLHGKQDKQKQQPAPATQKLKLQDFYGEPIPGALNMDRDLVEAGHPMWLEIDVSWPKNYPSAAEYDVVPMVTPGHGASNVSLLKCDWHIELVGNAGASPAGAKAAAPAAAMFAGGANAALNAKPAGSPSAPTNPAPGGAAAAAARPEAAASPASAASSGVNAHTDVGELHHTFILPPGQDHGTFQVTVRASFDEYFEPREFTKTVEVKSTAAAMKQLGDDAFADLGSKETSRTKETFDASGSGDDNHGYRTTGDLPASFQPSTLDGPDPRAASRQEQRKRLEATRVYLEANGAQRDVLAAVDRELEASSATEAALASDRSKGWQPFQIRGTYLSREDGVPSGPLTLYGSVHSEPSFDFKLNTIAVQIRDLSRRFDNEDMSFSGRGPTFDDALKKAFIDNAKAYPKGVMEIEAEAIDARVEAGQPSVGKATGKTIGFQLGTDSRWKRVKADVWDPAVNMVTNLGAMAIMAFVPGAAVVVAPLLMAYNSIPAADRLRTESERGTLTLGTAATSVGEIALNLLPLAGRAKAFTREWFLIEGANWGGQAVLMTASAIQTARQLQSQDVEALASMYEELQKLEAQPGANPAVLAQKRADIMKRAKDVSHRIDDALTDQIAQNAMMAVAGSVIHNAATENQRSDVIDAYLKSRGAGREEPPSTQSNQHEATAAAAGHPAEPGEHAGAKQPDVRTGASDEQHRGSAKSTIGRNAAADHSGHGPSTAHDDSADREARTSGHRAEPQGVTKEGLVDALAQSKSLAEQHAHADGSVPVSSVLTESRDLTVEQRARQIEDLRKILDEVAEEAAKALADGKVPVDPAISDLRPGHRVEKGGTVTPQDKVTLVSLGSSLAEERGLVERLYEAKVAVQHELEQSHPDRERVLALTENVQVALRSYREHLVMRKPNYARYADDVQTGAEFFRRYKMITGHNLTPRDIANTRSSAGQLASQELRVGIGGDSMKDIAALKEVAKDFNDANDEARRSGDQTDVSLIVNTTKNKSKKAAHAEEMARLIEAWAGDADLQRAVSGLDNAGVESADLPPSKLWKMSAKRAFMNADRVKGELAVSLPANEREAFIQSLGRVIGGDQAQARVTLERFQSFDFSAAMAAVDARSAADNIAVTQSGVVTETFAGMTMEEAATSTRRVLDALRARRAETGDTRELPRVLGYTVHAGEQLKDVDPFVLLKQVEESINLGADRIGHGLILTIDAHQLVRMGRLPEARVAEFVARQEQVRDHAKNAGVTIEMNITSNTEISNLAADEHPTATMVKSGLRVSVSTDDETTLGTTVKDELRRLAAAPGTSRTDVAIVILEGFYSRMGARPLADRARLRTEYLTTLTHGLSPTELGSLATALSQRFHTATVEGDPRATIDRVLAAVFGTGG